MTNLQRLTGKIFGETATATGDDPQIGQFGSALNGTYVGTTDVATIQNLPAWSNGFIDSVTPNEQFPPLPEMTGFGKVLSYQTAYTLQKGVPEWDAGTTYYTGDICKGIGEGKLYISLTDSNINNVLTDSNNWSIFSTGANTDLSNLTATGKTKVVNLANELDWANAITVSTTSSTSTQTYTATANGMFFVVSYMEGGSSTKTCSAYIIKNKLLSTNHMYGNTISGTGSAYLTSINWYAKSGEQITFYIYTYGTATYKECQATFVPFKKS